MIGVSMMAWSVSLKTIGQYRSAAAVSRLGLGNRGDIFPIQFKIMETAEFLSALRSLVPVVFSE